MIFMVLLTIMKYVEITNFRDKSQEYSFVLDGNNTQISALKADLQTLTFQEVKEEILEDGKYRLTFRCPPDRIKNILNNIDEQQIEIK